MSGRKSDNGDASQVSATTLFIMAMLGALLLSILSVLLIAGVLHGH